MTRPDITLNLTPQEVDFIANVLANVSFGTATQAKMTHLLAKISDQANRPQAANDNSATPPGDIEAPKPN